MYVTVQQLMKNADQESITKSATLCKVIWDFYGLFTGFTHHTLDGIVGNYRAINGTETYSLSNDECLIQAKNPAVYSILVGKFIKNIYDLSSLIPEHETA